MDAHTVVMYFYAPFDLGAVALALVGQGGLAGMVCSPIDSDHQALLQGKALDSPMSYYQVARLHSSTKWDWRQHCVAHQITEENEWYGGVTFYIRLDDR